MKTTPGELAIRLKNLTFSFQDAAAPALLDVSLEIGRGEVVAITGPSGCGKSTLAMAIDGYIPHAVRGSLTGTVDVCGRNTAEASLLDIAMLVGIVQQDPEAQLCTLTVEDEVAFGPENLGLPLEEIKLRVEASLAAAEASHLRGRSIYELSGGEKQRVALASMLAMNPEVLILDEPTSNLDPAATADVFRAILKLKEKAGMTILVIEHKLGRALEIADRLIVLDQGRVVMDGSPAAIAPLYREKLATVLPERPGESPTPASAPECLKVEGVCFGYEGREVLHDVSFSARPGEIVGIMGRNGSGKTTFLAQIIGFHRPGRGKVRLLGRDSSRLKVTEAARHVGYVFQNPNHQIFERTVRAEAEFACRNMGFKEPEGEARATEELTRYGLLKYEKGHPLRLSFGEKRRLNLCSVLTYGPEILVLDEPTVGQDLANSALLARDLLGLRKAGKTVLFVTHDAELAHRCCDRIVFFQDGHILIDADPESAFRKLKEAGYTDYLPEGFS